MPVVLFMNRGGRQCWRLRERDVYAYSGKSVRCYESRDSVWLITQMIWVTSEDEQLLQKTVAAMQDYLHIAHFFNLRKEFAEALTYLCDVTPTLFEATCSRSSSQQPLTPLEGDGEDDVRIWKCLNTLRLLLRSVTHYSTFIEGVGSLVFRNI